MSPSNRARRPAPRRRRRGAGLVLTFLLVSAGAVFTIAVALDSFTTGGTTRPTCYVDGSDGQVRLSPEQMGNAAVIAGVGMEMGASERAVTIALATAMQESSLRNLDHGDRDSLGLFQQRPSQGWGSEDQVQDRVYSSKAFYSRLLELPGYADMPLTQAAQAVQISAFPEAYAKHEPLAEALHMTFSGASPGALNCTLEDSAEFDPALFLTELAEAHPGARANAAGEEITLFPGSAGADDERDRWALAHWAVATAAETGANSVRVADQVWTRAGGWQPASPTITYVAVR